MNNFGTHFSGQMTFFKKENFSSISFPSTLFNVCFVQKARLWQCQSSERRRTKTAQIWWIFHFCLMDDHQVPKKKWQTPALTLDQHQQQRCFTSVGFSSASNLASHSFLTSTLFYIHKICMAATDTLDPREDNNIHQIN
jgi:hypothetical protein